ncbi:MAG: ATP-binding protein [Alphaproteobacteria bacterium]|nr:ATP-binding protein [Alphaproteobacteria bacterium]
MSIERTLAKSILDASRSFYVVMVTGPRQVGKTTLLQGLQNQERSYVSLDDIDQRLAARNDPAGFLDRLKLPVLIDEVQYAPELFPYIKILVDKEKKPGLFWLTGSQQFLMMKNVSESLAGRVAILDMQGISLAEEEGRPNTSPFIPALETLKERHSKARYIGESDIYYKIWRGSYPQVVTSKENIWQRFYESYITTYIERDVRDYLRVDDLMAFRRFIQLAASRTGQMLNYRDISKEIGLSEPTIKSWFNVLAATGLVVFIQPYFNNFSKRLIKTPKFYFMDTGLCCFLTGWITPDVLLRGAMSGPLLETYGVSEIIKSYIHNGQRPPLFYYADTDKKEVDLLIEQSGQLYPIEIKKAASIYNTKFKGFSFLTQLKTPIGHGCVLSFHKSLTPFNEDVDIVPMSYI